VFPSIEASINRAKKNNRINKPSEHEKTMSLLKSSKTWPSVLTMAFVQLRVDQKGRTYSAIINSPKFIKKDNFLSNHCTPTATAISTATTNQIVNNNVVIKSQEKLDGVVKSSSSVEKFLDSATDKVQQQNYTTIIQNDDETLSCRHHHKQHHHHHQQQQHCQAKKPVKDNHWRTESIKVDNWDYIYREKEPLNANLR
jgi:hypothetical protein